MPEAENQDREVMRAIERAYNALEALLRKKNAALENLKREKKREVESLLGQREEIRRQYLDSERENQAAFDELEERIRKLIKKINALTSTAPIHVGRLVCPTENGRVLILDNHRMPYEVPFSPDINPDDLEEGSEVLYTVDLISGNPVSFFEVRKMRR